jgi:hypothetical protein
MKHRTRGERILSVFKERKKPPAPDGPDPQASPLQEGSEDDIHSRMGEDYGPRKRAIARYIEATRVFKQTIEISQESWGQFDIQALIGEPEDFDDTEPEFKSKINLALASKEAAINDRNLRSECKPSLEYIFTALSPQAKHIQTIVNERQSVRFPSVKLSSNRRFRYLCFVHTG